MDTQQKQGDSAEDSTTMLEPQLYQHQMKIIAHIRTDFHSKFGIPRQSGIVEETEGQIIFEPAFRNPDALRGLEGFSHLWLIWKFSETERKDWSPTVRPPRLGGEKRMGVFATRSPFRPNAIGLSSVKLKRIELDSKFGPVLYVSGADLLDQTPIFDIKPYLAYTDAHPDAVSSYAAVQPCPSLEVVIPDIWLVCIAEKDRAALRAILAQDPRPRYQKDPERVYAFEYGSTHIRFQVNEAVLTVCYAECIS